ncbi:transmembrane protein 60 isoform X2 [Ambystoma mexicanum]|uniref:transmembrane protein 60 isoform X2 n=1 Tax=Ambystoma mexicanum TaxID=8296 RepID=UPI0037E9A3E9
MAFTNKIMRAAGSAAMRCLFPSGTHLSLSLNEPLQKLSPSEFPLCHNMEHCKHCGRKCSSAGTEQMAHSIEEKTEVCDGPEMKAGHKVVMFLVKDIY